MLLVDSEIRELAKGGILQNADVSAIGPVSCDLHARSFAFGDELVKFCTLKPGESAFVEAREVIDLPGDLVAHVLIKNSRLRQGFDLSAPLYFPGHHTRVFFRVSNVSAQALELREGMSLAQIAFERLARRAEHTYSGAFADELDFSGLASYKDVYASEMHELEEKKADLEQLEGRIYGNMLGLFAIVAAVFTIVNVNAGLSVGNADSRLLVTLDFAILGSFSVLAGFIGIFVKPESRAAKVAPLVVGGITLLASLLLALGVR